MSYFPFHALGFRCNPFVTVTEEEWAEIAVLPDHLAALLAHGFVHLQLLGEAGRGKTTALLGLVAHFRRQGRRVTYEYLPHDRHRFDTEPRELDLFCLDEAQRLSPRQRRRLVSITGGSGVRLVLGTHEDLYPLFTRPGLPLATVNLDDARESHLRAVLEQRLDYFALGDVPRVTLASDALEYLGATFGSNLRGVESFLYEVFQRLRETGPITAEQLKAHREAPE